MAASNVRYPSSSVPPSLDGTAPLRARHAARWHHARRALVAWTLVFGAFAFVLCSNGRTAWADGAADEADLHFQIAAEAYQKGDFPKALEHFMQSNRLVTNRNVVFNIARTFEQMKRFADAHRYYVDSLQGETDPHTIAEINAAIARIAPRVAVLRVETTPPGATIYIDRRDLGSRGRSPRPLGLPEGHYKVLVELDGYEPAEAGPFDARNGNEVRAEFTLKRILGRVHVDVAGAATAEVHLDDERAPVACRAPCDFDTSPGLHTLFFTMEGHQALPVQVNVVARETVRSVARLSIIVGSLAVTADERDAVVEIDGRPAGFTPTVIPNVAAGLRKVRIVLRGYAPVEREVLVRPNQQADLLDVRLEPLRQISAVSRVIESVDDAPSSLTIIDAQELRAFAYPTIAEALRGVRGVSISKDGAYYSANIRGIGQPNDYGNRLLVLQDGASLNDNLLDSSYIGSDGRVDLGDIDRIEVVRGPGSLLYGTGAFSGVVNLVTRSTDEPDSVHVGGSTYDNNVARGRAGFRYNFTRDAGIWGSVAASRSDGQNVDLTLLNGTARTVTHVDSFDAQTTTGRVWYGPLTAQWFYSRRDQGIPTGVYGTVVNDHNTVYTDERALGEVRYEPHISQEVQLFTRFHADHYHFAANYQYPPAGNPTVNLEDYEGTWGGLEARMTFTRGDWVRVTAGGEAQHHPQADLYGGVPASDGRFHPEKCSAAGQAIDPADQAYCKSDYLDSQNRVTFGAGYAIAEISPRPWIRISGGVRADVYSSFGAIAVPRGAVIFKPWTGGVFKLMGGRAFRAPSIYETFYNDGGNTQVANTQKLAPESIVSGELEFSQRFATDWVALIAAHGSQVTNIIDTIDTPCVGIDAKPGSTCSEYANTKSPVVLLGGDIELRREWRQGWMVSAYYSYQYAHYTNYQPLPGSGENPNDTQLINAPEHLAAVKGAVPIIPDIATLGARATLESPRRISLADAGLPAVERTTDAAVVADVVLSGRARRYGVGYAIGVYNLFDWRYEYPVAATFASRTMPQNGRTFLLDLTLAVP